MTSNLLNILQKFIGLKEVESLRKYFAQVDIEEASYEQKLIYVKYLALVDSIALAQIYIEKWGLESESNLYAELNYLAGDLNKAKSYLPQIEDSYLKADILLLDENFKEAQQVLKKESISAKWFYYSGRIYSHLNQLEKADKSLNSALNLYYRHNDVVMTSVIISNLVVLKSRQQQNHIAYSLSNQLRELLKKIEFKDFPESKAKLLINQGLYLGNNGHPGEAISCIIRAKLTLDRFPNSNDFIRVQLTYAYNIMDLGYIKKAIRILQSITPVKKFQQFDKYRYLMKAYALLDDSAEYEKALEKAYEFQDKSDSFDIIHLEIDRTESEFYLNQELPNFLKAKNLTQKYDDQESYYYLINKINFLSLNFDNLDDSIKFHTKNSLFKELNKDRILVALKEIQTKDYSNALEHLDRIPLNSSPKIKELKGFLKEFCQSKLTGELRINDQFTYKDPILKIIQHYLDRDTNDSTCEVLVLFKSLKKHQKHFLKRLLEILNINLLENIIFLKDGRKVSLTRIEILEIMKHPVKSIIDFKHNIISIRGNDLNKRLKSEVQINLLEFLVNNHLRYKSKESIILEVFNKAIYDPLIDDNLIYVNINRLKKTLGYKDSILTKDGHYKLNTKDLYLGINDL